MTFRMPPEWAPHERTWMAWPGPNVTFTGDDLAESRRAWASVARAVRRFEPVTMVVGPGQAEGARAALGPDIDLVERELDDAWMRDIGPTFVTDGSRLAAVDWVFNGWGAQDWATWEHDAKIARHVADLAGSPCTVRRWSTRAAASTSTARAPSCSPRPSSSARNATRAGPGKWSRPRSMPSWAPRRRSG